MHSCTGSALVCLYCTRPNTAPTPQMSIPRYISVDPLTPPSPSNFTWAKSGIFMSASPAKAVQFKANNAAGGRLRIQNFRCGIVMISRLP